jgi:hypothetical protein
MKIKTPAALADTYVIEVALDLREVDEPEGG